MIIKLRCYEMAVQFYQRSKTLKMEMHLRSQWNRACSSIALNIAEGYGKPTLRDKKKYFAIALGSLRECQAILDLCGCKDPALLQLADFLGGSLYKLSHL
jgi:four helix bundle protein